jgi:hypothetical protein
MTDDPAAPAEPDSLLGRRGPHLDAEMIVSTVKALRRRILERFPGSGLGRLADDLQRIAEATNQQLRWVAKPNVPLRLASWAVGVIFAVLLVSLLLRLEVRTDAITVSELLQASEAAFNDAVLLGAAFYFLGSLEARLKRRRALRFLRELRAMAHIVDMHQLTKDPAALVQVGTDTPSSPRRSLTRYELSRYLDYCSEMLALNSKLAALYAQNFDDPVVLGAVDEVETLTTGLSGKIWQKIVILTTPGGEERDAADPDAL